MTAPTVGHWGVGDKYVAGVTKIKNLGSFRCVG